MIPEKELKDWMDTYDYCKGNLLAVLRSKNMSKTEMLKVLSARAKVFGDMYKEYARTRKEDGNLVPVVFADIMSTNIAMLIVTTMAQCFADKTSPDDTMALVKSIIYSEVSAPLSILSWDSAQHDWIDEALMGEDGTDSL